MHRCRDERTDENWTLRNAGLFFQNVRHLDIIFSRELTNMVELETSSSKSARSVKIQTLLVLFLLYATPAFAYLDPGTGSILLQGIIASIAAMLAAGGVFWHRIKGVFFSLFSSSDTSVADSETEKPE